ncbi:MAG: hypothetical protein JW927_12285 [Deltaproteobacteria bacterium]|nr:hypothetical protein [Deltaproteobacteria bacterium]
MFVTIYYSISILYFLLLLTCIAGLKKIELVTCICAVAVNLAGLLYIYSSSGTLPVFNLYESFLFDSFIMGATGLFFLFKGDFSIKVRRWVWAGILVLLLVMSFFPKEVSLPAYDHGYSYIIMFHLFRCIALALMLVSTAWFVQFIIQREMNERTSILSHMGRNYLVLASVFYLAAEYVGIIWCQKGWGDFWTWSQAFFQSTLVVIYLMLAFHIPGKGRKAEDIRSVIGALSGVFFLTLVILRSTY